MPGLPPEEVARLLDERAERLEQELARTKDVLEQLAARGLPRLNVVELEYHAALREAELAFTRSLAREIAAGTLEGIETWKTYHRRRSRT